ncbi:flagellar hook-length control protein FliK [Affinibrenneria salicis]|uniref:Flagellar hook-length control protein FliK n=2 Tax=Affinibrenneria salicis TaxID=2590031 RepID=A0A5J5FT98_9GAMM|nr:flagellar hook-length control protein FliK [Affinibrenneria salicis]
MAMIQASQSPTAAPTAPIGEAVEQQAAIPALVSALPQAKTSTDQTDKSTLLSDGAEQKAQPAATSASGSSFTQRLAAQSDDAASLANSNKALQQDVALSASADDKTSFSSSSLRDGQSLAAHASVNSAVQQPIAASAQAPVTQTSASVAPVVTAQINAQLGSDEWQQAVSQQVIMFSRNGQQTAELRLHPQELGSLQISLKLDDNQAQLHLVSANSQVRAAMEAALPHLRTSMAESGINLGQASVGSDASSGWQQQAQQQSEGNAGSGQNRLSGVDIAGATLVQPPTAASVISVQGRVDIFA